MSHGLIPDAVIPNAWISFLGCAWSLITEWQFYVLIAVLAPALRAADPAHTLARLSRLFLAISVLALAWAWAGPETWRFSKAFLPNKAQYFALGVASAGWGIDATPRAARRFAFAVCLVVALCVAQGGLGKLAAPLVWTACLLAQRASPGGAGWGLLRWLATILRAPPLLIAGAASYSIYLMNEPVQKVLGLVLARYAQGDGLLFTLLWVPGAIILPLGLAWVLHKRVEQPALRAGRQLLARAPWRLPDLYPVAASAATRGRRRVACVPSPGAERSVKSAPIWRTSAFTIVVPRLPGRPPAFSAMPTPSSPTAISIVSPSKPARTRTMPRLPSG